MSFLSGVFKHLVNSIYLLYLRMMRVKEGKASKQHGLILLPRNSNFFILKTARCLWYQCMKQFNRITKKVLNKKFSICWSTSSVPVAQLWSPQHLQPQANILPQRYLAYYAWSHIVTSLAVCQFTEKHPLLFLQNSSYSKMHFGSVGGTMKFLRIGSSIFPKSPCLERSRVT